MSSPNFIFPYFEILLCVYVCVFYLHVFVCIWRPEEVWDPLKLELNMVVKCTVGAGLKSGSSESTSAISHRASFPPLSEFLADYLFVMETIRNPGFLCCLFL